MTEPLPGVVMALPATDQRGTATKMATWNPQRASFVRLEALKSAGNDGAAACELQVALTPLK